MITIAIIPARGNSKRLPNKNIIPFQGKPLIAHSISYAQAYDDIIDEIYVSTNDEDIKTVALDNGAKVIDRPEHLSGDFEPTITCLKHALSILPSTVENIILLQPTNPLRPVGLLYKAFENYTESKKDSLFTVSRTHRKLGRIDNDKFKPFNYEIGQRSQDLEPLYYENGLLYISKVSLIRQNKIISANAIPYIVNDIMASVDIDTQEDLDYAHFVFNRNKNK